MVKPLAGTTSVDAVCKCDIVHNLYLIIQIKERTVSNTVGPRCLECATADQCLSTWTSLKSWPSHLIAIEHAPSAERIVAPSKERILEP